MGIYGSANSMTPSAMSPQMALELRAQQVLRSGQIPPLNLQGASPAQLQEALNTLVIQGTAAGAGTAVEALSRYQANALMQHAQQTGLRLQMPTLPTSAMNTPGNSYSPYTQGAFSQSAAPQSTAAPGEYQLGMGIPGMGLEVGGQHFDFGAMTPTRTAQLLAASGQAPAQPAAPQGYGYSPSPYGQSAAYPQSYGGYGGASASSGQSSAFGLIGALGGPIGTGSTSDFTRNIGTSIATMGTGGFSGGGGYNTAPNTGMSGYGATGYGAMGNTNPYGAAYNPAMAGYGAAGYGNTVSMPGYGASGYGNTAPMAGYGATGYGSMSPTAGYAPSGYSSMAPMGGYVSSGLGQPTVYTRSYTVA